MQMLDDGEIAIPSSHRSLETQPLGASGEVVTKRPAGKEQPNRNGHVQRHQHSPHESLETIQTGTITKGASPPHSSNSPPSPSHPPVPLIPSAPESRLQNQRFDDASSQTPIVITGELLLNFQRCKRRAFLDKYASVGDKDKTSDYLRKLQQDSLIHQRKVLSQHPTQIPKYQARQWDEGFAETLKLMQQGVSHIEKGVLQATYVPTVTEFGDSPPQEGLEISPHSPEDDHQPIILVSRPKLLVRISGQSKFGNWFYVPADIKLGKRPKADYQVVAAFHSPK